MKVILKESGKEIDVYLAADAVYKNTDITDIYEYNEEDFEIIETKYTYYISQVGFTHDFVKMTLEQANIVQKMFNKVSRYGNEILAVRIPEIEDMCNNIFPELDEKYRDKKNAARIYQLHDIEQMLKEKYPEVFVNNTIQDVHGAMRFISDTAGEIYRRYKIYLEKKEND